MDFIISTILTLTALIWWATVGAVFLTFGLFLLVSRFLKGQARLVAKEAGKVARRVGLPDVKISSSIRSHLKTPELDVRGSYNRFEEEVYKRTCWFMRSEIAAWVKKGESLLDVGSGSGYLARELKKRLGVRVVGADVIDLRKTDIPLVLFDGLHLPFQDNSFDNVLFSYVLHHAGKNQGKLLKEAKRVIVFEDEAVGGFGDLFTSFHGLAYDFLNNIKGNNPCLFRDAKGWERLFKKLGFKILDKKVDWEIASIVIPVKKSFFVLEV